MTGQSLVQHISDYSLALLMLTVVTFVPTSSIVYLVQERTSQEKLVNHTNSLSPEMHLIISSLFTFYAKILFQVQRSLGCGPLTYWAASLLWDTAVTCTFLAIASVVIQVFQVRETPSTPGPSSRSFDSWPLLTLLNSLSC